MAKYADTNLTHLRVSYNLFLKTTKNKAFNILMNNIAFDGDCWIWTGEINIKGTGVISVNSKRFGLKKISYLTFIGDIPNEKAVYNTCQKKLCFNPQHLYLRDAGFNYNYIKNNDPEFISNVCQDLEAGISNRRLAMWYDRSFYTIRLITMTYREKLRDPRWQKKRLEVFERDGWKCTVCGDDKNELHVHHVKYIIGVEPWDVPINYLKTLCKKHHLAAHRLRRNRKRN